MLFQHKMHQFLHEPLPSSPPLTGSSPLTLQARAIQEVSEAESSESTAARIQLDIDMQAPLIAVLLEEGLRGEGWGQEVCGSVRR